MKEVSTAVIEPYARALRAFLAGGGESALKEAYELGRQALEEGLGVLEMARVHNQALGLVRATKPSFEEDPGARQAIESFLLEALCPFEIVHRGCREANIALRRINETLEEESRRIAHALHDEAGPLLVSAHIALAELERVTPSASLEQVEAVRQRLNEIEEQIRRLSHELRPTILDDLGLVPAVRFLADGISIRTGLRIEVEADLVGRLPALVETALYRIAQEALLNAGKHSRATLARVRLTREPRQVQCAVVDDGRGFEPGPNGSGVPGRGLGLLGIRQRLEALGGTLRIVSALGRGAELHITIPLEA